jgi:raffinose/stachyose/melibiose transport system permease protein
MKKKSILRSIWQVIYRVGLVLLYLLPIAMLFWVALKSAKDIAINILGVPTEWIGFENFSLAIERMDFLMAFKNSLVVTVVSTVCLCIFSAMAAWVLVRNKMKMSSFIFMLFSVSMLIPFQCVMLPLMKIMGKFGLGQFGIDLMNHQGLILAYIGFGSAMSIMLYHGFIKGIPVELEEAAAIDGCSTPGIFFRIVLPLLAPITTTVGIVNIMWIWNDYLLPSIVLSGKSELRTLPLQTYQFFGSFTTNWGVAAAALLLIMLPVIIFYILAQKKIIKGVVDGAVK